MESEDDNDLFSLPHEENTSSPVNPRQFKRLRKAIRVSKDLPATSPGEILLLSPRVSSVTIDKNSRDSEQFSKPESINLEVESEKLGSDLGEVNLGVTRALEIGELRRNGEESSDFRSELGTLEREKLGVKRVLEFDRREIDGNGGEIGNLEEEAKSRDVEGEKEELGVKRALEFDSLDGDDDLDRNEAEDVNGGLENGNLEYKLTDFSVGVKKKKRSKRVKILNKTDNDDCSSMAKENASNNKRKEERERREYLKHLHAESQRLLRETRDAGFKPVPLVQKPISSILEKIRKRKLEVSKKVISLDINYAVHEGDDSSREDMMNLNSEKLTMDESEHKEFAKVVKKDVTVDPAYAGSSSITSSVNGNRKSLEGPNYENMSLPQDMDEETKSAFRAPINDTQDLFSDSQNSNSKDDLPSEENEGPAEQSFAPSLVAINLKFDSAPLDGVCSDEEDNDKENTAPYLHGLDNEPASPRGDPVKAFVDEEAVEEDDSDNDQLRFPENKDDDIEDAEELNDMIVTTYEEKEIDRERRHGLHMKMLEQQDAAGVENLLQRLGCGTKQRETTLLEEEYGMEEDEEFSDEDSEDIAPKSAVRINSRKVKEMIPQMFTDKDDVYISSDDEETEQMVVKQRILEKSDKQATFMSPMEDDSSREVFGLIKKLNIVQDTKKKAKLSSSINILSAMGTICSKKSSFVGRLSNTNGSLPSSHKHGTNMVRSFIFGRDDSNSRSSISVSEDSSDTIQKEIRSARTSSANKFSNSQSKSYTQSTNNPDEKISGTSLFDILRQPSLQNKHCHQEDMVGHCQSLFSAFKLPKKPLKVERNH